MMLAEKEKAMCPNQRKKGKKIVGAWVEPELYNDVKERAEEMGIPMTEVMRRLIDDYLKVRKGSNHEG